MEQLRQDGSTVILTTHYLEEAQQRADRIGLMHRGTLRHQGTVAELTRTLPASIQFSLPPGAPALPLESSPDEAGTFHVETAELQRDLKVLLDWAAVNRVELSGLSAAPTRLDDVFRAIGTDQVTP